MVKLGQIFIIEEIIKNPDAGGNIGELLYVYRSGEKPANEALKINKSF